MDLNDIRIVVTLLSLGAFLGIVAWAYAKHNRHRFEEAAGLPFDGEPGTEHGRSE